MKNRFLRILSRFLLIAAVLCAAFLIYLRAKTDKTPEGELLTESTAVEDTSAECSALIISEVMSNNHSVAVDGTLCDWIELLNCGEEALELKEYSISKSNDLSEGQVLPDTLILPGEFAVLCCGRDLDFNLDKNGCELYLFKNDCTEPCDEALIPKLGKDSTWNADVGVSWAPTPGKENFFSETAVKEPSPLVITEIMASNVSAYQTETGYSDWIEFYNASSETVALSDYYLSRSSKNLFARQLPNVMLESGEYYVLTCSGSGKDNDNFSLRATGDTLFLTRCDGKLLSVTDYPEIPTDMSWGGTDESMVYYLSPSPGRVNGAGYESLVASPSASVESGNYTEPFSVTLSGEGRIYYTTNGTVPTERSTLYSGEDIPVESNIAIRAISVVDGKRNSDIATFNYFMNIPDYELDVVKVTLAPIDYSINLSSPANTEDYRAHIAMYSNGVEQFSEECLVSLFGSGSRVLDKKSYQIKFKAAIGNSKLRYKLFDDLDIDEFNSIVLRSGAQGQFYGHLRDEFFSEICHNACEELLVQAYRPVHLYMNGEYLGIYYIREHVDEDMIASHINVSDDSVSIVKGYNLAPYGPNGRAWREIQDFITGNDMSDEGNYSFVQENVNILGCIDFFIAEMWCTNYDLGNFKVFQSPDYDDGKWNFVLYDLDVAFLLDDSESVKRLYNDYNGMLKSLMENQDFKEMFTRRMAELLNGPYEENTVISQLNEMQDLLSNDMKYSCERWIYKCTYEQWLGYLDSIRSAPGVGITGRTDRFIRQYISIVKPDADLIRECFGEQYVA